jgi:hypothetical protein
MKFYENWYFYAWSSGVIVAIEKPGIFFPNFKNFKKNSKFQNFQKISKISVFIKFHKISKLKKKIQNLKILKFQNFKNFKKIQNFHKTCSHHVHLCWSLLSQKNHLWTTGEIA